MTGPLSALSCVKISQLPKVKGVFSSQSELFQGDIFPDCPGDEPALTADEWLEGKNADPKLMCMEDKFKGKTSGSGRKTGSKGLAKKTKVADSSKASAEDEVKKIGERMNIHKCKNQ